MLSLRSFLRSSRCTHSHTRKLAIRACLSIIAHASYSLPAHRTLSTSSLLTTIKDPTRSSLFYHLLPAPNPLSADLPSYAVSFLDQPPRDGQSPSVIGWLPAAASAEGGEEAGLSEFKENPNFMDLVHKVVQQSIEEGSNERLKAEAVQCREGWMHINDDRNVPAMGRIGSPDDIIASVRVEDGKMLPETYSAMPAYRTCTADGLTTLSEELEQKLLDELRRSESEDQSWKA